MGELKPLWAAVGGCKRIRSGVCVCCLCFGPDPSLLVVNRCMNSYTNLYWLLLLIHRQLLVSLLDTNLTNNCLLPALSWVVTCNVRLQDVLLSRVAVKEVCLWQLQHSGSRLPRTFLRILIAVRFMKPQADLIEYNCIWNQALCSQTASNGKLGGVSELDGAWEWHIAEAILTFAKKRPTLSY